MSLLKQAHCCIAVFVFLVHQMAVSRLLLVRNVMVAKINKNKYVSHC